MCEAVSGKKVPNEDKETSQNVTKLLEMISKLDSMADKVEPAEQQQRFGNKAFRTWYEQLQRVSVAYPSLCTY